MEKIANRYTSALVVGASTEEIAKFATVFSGLSTALNDSKVKEVFNSPYISKEQKEEILLDAVANVKSDKINNLLRVLVSKNRTQVIGAIHTSLVLTLEKMTNTFSGTIQSSIALDGATSSAFNESFSKKIDSTVNFDVEKSNYDGIKVTVGSLGLEVGLSKTVVKDQMIEHILKSI